MLRFFFIVILILSQIGCYKSAEFSKSDFYFFRAVLINDRPPMVLLGMNNLNGMETYLNSNEFQVLISTPSGEMDSLINGVFKNIKCVAGRSYKIRWKRNVENKWHEIIERIPEKTNAINRQNFRNENGQLYFENVQLNNSDRLNLDYDWFPDIPNPYIHQFGWGIPGLQRKSRSFGDLYSEGDKLIFWPPLSHDFNFIVPPQVYFNWEEVLPYKRFEKNPMKLVVKRMSETDFAFFKQINSNFDNLSNPIYLGNSQPFEYKNENMYGHVFSYCQSDLDILDVLPKEAPVTYRISYKGLPIDTNNIQIEYFSVRSIENSNVPTFSLSFFPSVFNDTLFFKDYFRSSLDGNWKYTEFKSNEDPVECQIWTHYIEKSTGKKLNYRSANFIYDYKLANQLNIDIP